MIDLPLATPTPSPALLATPPYPARCATTTLNHISGGGLPTVLGEGEVAHHDLAVDRSLDSVSKGFDTL